MFSFITSSVSLTLEREGGGHTDSVTRPNLRTQRPTERFIVLSDSSHHSSTNAADDEVTSIIRSSMPPPPVLTAAVATTIIIDATFTLGGKDLQHHENALCERFHVLDTVHPELPVRNDRIRNSPTGKIGMDLFAFIHHADPTKVQIGETEGVGDDDVNEESGDAAGADHVEENDHAVQDEGDNIVRIEDEVPASIAERAKGSRKKRKVTGRSSGFGLPPKKLRGNHGTSGAGENTGGKSVAALQGLLERSTLLVEVGVAARPTERFIVLPDSSQHSSTSVADDEVTSIVKSSMPPPPVLTAAVATTIIADTTFALVPRVGIKPVPYIIFRDSVSIGEANQDVVGPSCPASTELSADSFFLFYEVRLRLEHELRGRKKFEGKCAMQTDWLNERDAEIASLKARLSLKEADAMEAICLRGQVTNVEAAEAARVNELNGLKERTMALKGQVAALDFVLSYDELSVKATSLKSKKDKLADQVSTLEATCSGLRDEVSCYNLFKEHIEAVQDKQVRVLSDCVVGLESELMEMALHMDEEFYPRYLTTIAGWRWILGRGLKLAVMKCLQSPEYLAALEGHRGLVDVAAYNPSVEANYVSAINALRVVGPVVETLEASQLQPSPEQLMLPIHRLEDQVVIRETSLSFSLDVAHARVQSIRGDVASRWLSLSNVMVPLIEPLSSENLVGEASTSGVPEVVTTTALSTTFIQASSVPPILVANDGVLGAE
ncbi:hypothetical protein Tco_0720618 [Tanacetum coccineum]